MHTQLQDTPSPSQRQEIAAVLGREPKGLVYVTAKDTQGHPLAIQVASLVDDKPFPTLYWLTSPWLVKEISHLEAAGLIKTWEALLHADASLMAAYHQNHQAYVHKRWAAMSGATKSQIERLGFSPLFAQRGIGGIANWRQVRCLHTHYAHHLSDFNLIGQWLDQEYGLADRFADRLADNF